MSNSGIALMPFNVLGREWSNDSVILDATREFGTSATVGSFGKIESLNCSANPSNPNVDEESDP
jgi:hypothetical protein